ncbi:hypothetical protein ILYODFUR_005548 [Ilyodon furcidens]|uniref:Uncharacterized protein n=1 Tax=Ilyodon furcidens TaxID=33524 RepID=A0ABV0V0I7_9TELE
METQETGDEGRCMTEQGMEMREGKPDNLLPGNAFHNILGDLQRFLNSKGNKAVSPLGSPSSGTCLKDLQKEADSDQVSMLPQAQNLTDAAANEANDTYKQEWSGITKFHLLDSFLQEGVALI